jgi:hypothetical protein
VTIDRRVDLYAVGVVLWELLTGQQPFRASVASILQKRDGTPRSPREVNPEVPEALAAVVTRLMAPRREHRCASAGEARALLVQAVPAWAAADERLAALVQALRRARTGATSRATSQPAVVAALAAHGGGPRARPEEPTLLPGAGEPRPAPPYQGAVPCAEIVDVESAVVVRPSPLPAAPTRVAPPRPTPSPATTLLSPVPPARRRSRLAPALAGAALLVATLAVVARLQLQRRAAAGAAQPAASTGFLAVTLAHEGDAVEVLIDDVAVGRAPVRRELSAGEHSVVARNRTAGTEWHGAATVRPGQEARLAL